MSDNVNHPSHYQGKVECIDALEAATEGLTGIEAFCTANAIKYLWRWKRKNGVEDLRKALWYLEHLIKKRTTTEATASARSADEAGPAHTQSMRGQHRQGGRLRAPVR